MFKGLMFEVDPCVQTGQNVSKRGLSVYQESALQEYIYVYTCGQTTTVRHEKVNK